MTLLTTEQAKPIAIDELDLSSLADALHAGTEHALGPLADAPAIQRFLQSVPNPTIAQLAVVQAICTEHPEAAQDIKRFERELREFLRELGIHEHPQKSIEPGPVYTQLVEIYLGAVETPFMVHKWYLIKIPYFVTHFDGALPDGNVNTIRLPNNNAEAFQRVLDFAYTGKLPEKLVSHYGVHDNFEAMSETLLVMETYLLGNELGMEQFSNDLIDRLRRSYKRMIPCEKEVKLALRKGNSQLKDLVLRKTAYGIFRHGWDVYLEVSSANSDNVFTDQGDWAEQLAKILAKYPNAKNPVDEENGCQWHVHVHTPKCRQDMPFPTLMPTVLRHEGRTSSGGENTSNE